MKKLISLVSILISVTLSAQTVEVTKAVNTEKKITIAYRLANMDEVTMVTLFIDGNTPQDLNKSDGEYTCKASNLTTNGSFYFEFEVDGRKVKSNIYELKKE